MQDRASRWMHRAGAPAAIGVGVVLITGVSSTVAAFLLGRPWVWQEFLYDVGLGAFTATAVSALLGLYLQSLERREQARVQRLAEEWQRIEGEIASLNDEYRRIQQRFDLNDLKNEFAMLAHTVLSVQGDVLRRMKEVLTRVDPDYKDDFDKAFDEAWERWVAASTTKREDGS